MGPFKKAFILCLIIVFSGSGCEKEKKGSPQPALTNTNWILSFVQNTTTNEIMNFPASEPKKIVISFSDSNVISFSGVCNVGEGTYTCDPENAELKVNNLVTTKIGCVNAEWEGYTVQSLGKANQYKIEGNNLTVYSSGNYDLYFVMQ
jgi:heat shock protein HslJ